MLSLWDEYILRECDEPCFVNAIYSLLTTCIEFRNTSFAAIKQPQNCHLTLFDGDGFIRFLAT
jgi:hypothetical protein